MQEISAHNMSIGYNLADSDGRNLWALQKRSNNNNKKIQYSIKNLNSIKVKWRYGVVTFFSLMVALYLDRAVPPQAASHEGLLIGKAKMDYWLRNTDERTSPLNGYWVVPTEGEKRGKYIIQLKSVAEISNFEYIEMIHIDMF